MSEQFSNWTINSKQTKNVTMVNSKTIPSSLSQFVRLHLIDACLKAAPERVYWPFEYIIRANGFDKVPYHS